MQVHKKISGLRSYYKKLIALRKAYPVVVYGKYETMMEDSEELYVYTRAFEKESLLVVCSFCDHDTYKRLIAIPSTVFNTFLE